MTDLRKAAEQALEALNSFELYDGNELWSSTADAYDIDSAINALRQALNVDAVNISQERVDETAKREQEPVAWRNVIPGGRMTDKWDSGRVADYNQGWNDYRKAAKIALEKLDTTPQPPAQSLTDEEIDEKTDFRATVRYFEAKLKEKNT